MEGSINTRNNVLSKFKEAKTESMPTDSANVIDFTAPNKFTHNYENEAGFKSYSLLGDEDLDIRKKSIKSGVAVIIEFKIVTNSILPYLLINMYKNSNNKLMFHKRKVQDGEIPNISNTDYEGLYRHEGVQYMFFKINNNDNKVVNISSDDKEYLLLVDDIVNSQKYYNFEVEQEVTDFFIKNDKFIFLIDEKKMLIEIPIAGYIGDYYKKIGLLAGLGMNRSGPYSSLGPFFYFGNFDRSLRYAAITINGEPLEIIGKRITIENTPVFTKGGVVKYAVFMGNSKVLLNLPDDEKDDSYESTKLASERKFIKDTLKLRDTNGKWTKMYDSVIQPELKIFDRDLGFERLLDPQFIVKSFDRQIPLDYAYFNTSHINKKDNGMYNVSELTMI